MAMTRARFLCGALVVMIAASTLAPADAEARAPTPLVPRTLGVTPGDARVEFDVVLRYRQAALEAFLERVNDPRSPGYHQYATAEEIGRRFGVSDEGVSRIDAWVNESGLEVVETFPQRTTMRVVGSAASVDEMLHVTLVDKLDPVSGQRFHAPRGTPRVPAALGDVVEAVAGLDNRPYLRPVQPLAPRESGATCATSASCLTPDKLARSFDISALHDRGIMGEGQYVAVIMDGPVSDRDLEQFQTTGGLVGVPPIERITVGNGPSTKESGQPISRAEATMDVETVQAVAPHATVLYFYASLGTFADAVNAVVRDGRAEIITFSAGGCDDGSTVYIADERALQTANAAGVNVFASSGDHGAFNCLAFDPNDFRPTASEPSDSPYVISVGATFLERKPDGTYIDEAAWVEPLDNWGTGGALNPSNRRPSWQIGPGVDNSYSNGKRQEPDVSAPGDPESGWFIVVDGEESRAGGTSASSPFWAGVTSLFEQMVEQTGLPGLGYLNPTLYALAAQSPPDTLFHDVVRGDNLLYPATSGWDFATGLGSPIVSRLGDAIVQRLLVGSLPAI
jgi:subtilase family serine protease